ncbi:Phosphatase [Oryctes borbonicus]|uniref:Phosphatase n=1 Tax=Oryctes borbonicus TaxID=1629725 RepID=A0A0T6BGM5_9SCAR|nr:Phosphatase [Oryctes borbonicus]
MTAVTSVLFVSLIAVGVYSSSALNSKELLLVHVISRHGARTPVDTYPTDPYINDTFYPVGWGQLTNEGKQDLFRLGQDLRKRYDEFLGDQYSTDLYYSQSTEVDRTLSSVQVINAGIWEPKGDQKWSSLNWQPIPVHYEPLNKDTLLLVRKTCAQYEIELRNVMMSLEVQEKLKLNKEIFEYLEIWSGNKIEDFDDVQDLYSTLYAEESFNLTLPEWTINVYPEKLYEMTTYSFHLRAYNTILTKLKGGVLLKKIIKDFVMKKDGTLKPKGRKLFVYGGHDSTIANLLSALKIFKPHVPDYAATIVLEFSRNRFTNEYGVEVYYRMSIDHPLEIKQLPNCDTFCPLDDFLRITADVVPENWDLECYTSDPNFVPSEPEGP